MGKITILESTTKNPYELIGMCAGPCYGSDTSSVKKNIRRGKRCIEDGHFRVAELPQIYFVAEDYSARWAREFYTHIGGSPTRLQSSTRYIEYGDFNFIIPPKILNNVDAFSKYNECMEKIQETYKELQDMDVPKEDIANILPLGMTTTITVRTNLRNLIDMSRQRMCARAYWEYRVFMNDLKNALSEYSPEWKELVDKYFVPKCEELGYCPEKTDSCGRKPNKE